MIALNDTTRRRLGYVVIATSAALGIGAVVLGILAGELAAVANVAIILPAFLVTAALAMRVRPTNGAVWALAGAGFFGTLSAFGSHLVAWQTGLGVGAVEGGELPGSPADYDILTALGANVALWAWIPSTFLLATFLLILFPEGRAPSKRWRGALWIAGASMLVLSLQGAIALAPWIETPYDEVLYRADGTTMAPPVGLLMLPLLMIGLAAVVRIVVSYRKTTGETRLQYRWVAWALGLYVVVGILLFDLMQQLGDIGGVLNAVLIANVPLSIGIAITKYRLYDIDIIISRSLVVFVLVGFITVVYAAVVVGVGSVMGGSSVGWSIAATALVAVVFEPVRSRVQRWVNRLVLGRRATPYEVLSDLTGRLAATEREEGLLPRMAERLAEGTGADRAVVWMRQSSGFSPEAAHPGALPRTAESLDAIPGSVTPIVHDGTLLGALSVESRRGDGLTPTELRLVEDLAGSAGLLMRRLRLDAELERKAVELEESRRRLVDAQDVERRRLERALNEGAQREVVALGAQLELAEHQASEEGSATAAALIAQLVAETRVAIEQIRALANGIYPPLLEAEGLSVAVTALGDVAPVDVRVTTDIDGRYPLPMEGAVYFCVSEALTNAVKHGRPPITIELSNRSGGLDFSVVDSGPGFDVDDVRRGSGLGNMADRVDALEGTITVTSSPGGHTAVEGRVPAVETRRVEVHA